MRIPPASSSFISIAHSHEDNCITRLFDVYKYLPSFSQVSPSPASHELLKISDQSMSLLPYMRDTSTKLENAKMNEETSHADDKSSSG